MSNMAEGLLEAMTIDGALGAAVVDYTSGMTLGTAGGGTSLDLEIAAAGITDVVRAQLRMVDLLGGDDQIEDILVTQSTQYHVLRPVATGEGLFLYLVLSRDRGNLALARRALSGIERSLVV